MLATLPVRRSYARRKKIHPWGVVMGPLFNLALPCHTGEKLLANAWCFPQLASSVDSSVTGYPMIDLLTPLSNARYDSAIHCSLLEAIS